MKRSVEGVVTVGRRGGGVTLRAERSGWRPRSTTNVFQAQLCLFMPELNRPQCARPLPSKGDSC